MKNLSQVKKQAHRKYTIREVTDKAFQHQTAFRFYFDDLADYTFTISLTDHLKKLDLEFLKALNKQSNIVRRSLATIYLDSKKIPVYYDIYKNLNKVNFIKYENGYCILHGRKLDSIKHAYDISIKELKLIFQDSELLRCRRNMLVNPDKVLGITKLTRSSLEFDLGNDTSVPIGRTYIESIKKAYPQFFS